MAKKQVFFDWKLKVAIGAAVVAIFSILWGFFRQPNEKTIDKTDYKKISAMQLQIDKLTKEARNIETIETYYKGELIKRTIKDMTKIDTSTDLEKVKTGSESGKSESEKLTYTDHFYLGLSGVNIAGGDDLLGLTAGYSTGSTLFILTYYRDYDYSQPLNITKLTNHFRDTIGASALFRIF